MQHFGTSISGSDCDTALQVQMDGLACAEQLSARWVQCFGRHDDRVACGRRLISSYQNILVMPYARALTERPRSYRTGDRGWVPEHR